MSYEIYSTYHGCLKHGKLCLRTGQRLTLIMWVTVMREWLRLLLVWFDQPAVYRNSLLNRNLHFRRHSQSCTVWQVWSTEQSNKRRGGFSCKRFLAFGGKTTTGSPWTTNIAMCSMDRRCETKSVASRGHQIRENTTVRQWYLLPAEEHHSSVPYGDCCNEYW